MRDVKTKKNHQKQTSEPKVHPGHDLKLFERMIKGLNYTPLVQGDGYAALRACSKFLVRCTTHTQALGTHAGSILILDLLGSVIKEFQAHSASVCQLALDDQQEYIASASDDGISLQ